MKIRDFRKEDAPRASSLIVECYQKLDVGGHTAIGLKIQIAGNSPENLLKRAGTINYFVAVDNDRVIGICGYDEEKIRTLFVDTKYQKLGIGSKLLETVLQEAKKEGLKTVTTWSTILAEPFYSLAGFQRVGEIALPPGKREIVLIEMVKTLGG